MRKGAGQSLSNFSGKGGGGKERGKAKGERRGGAEGVGGLREDAKEGGQE